MRYLNRAPCLTLDKCRFLFTFRGGKVLVLSETFIPSYFLRIQRTMLAIHKFFTIFILLMNSCDSHQNEMFRFFIRKNNEPS